MPVASPSGRVGSAAGAGKRAAAGDLAAGDGSQTALAGATWPASGATGVAMGVATSLIARAQTAEQHITTRSRTTTGAGPSSGSTGA
jgi:hypothetical protein